MVRFLAAPAVSSDATPADVDETAAAAGTAVSHSRGDHRHIHGDAAATVNLHDHAGMDGIAANDHHAEAHAQSVHTDRVPRVIEVAPKHVNGTGTLDATKSNHAVANIGDAANDGDAWFEVEIPPDFTALVSAVISYGSDETANTRLSVQTRWGGSGEAQNLNSDSIAEATIALTAEAVTKFDLAAALTGIAAGDSIAVNFIRGGSDVLDTITTMWVMTLRLEYD